MHVLHLSATGALGGAERSMLDIVASVREANPDWRLSIVTGADGSVIGAAKALGAGARGRLARSANRAARRTAWHGGTGRTARGTRGQRINTSSSCAISSRSCGPDVIHTHGLKMHILAAWAAGAIAAQGRVRASSGTCTTTSARGRATARFLRWSLRTLRRHRHQLVECGR